MLTRASWCKQLQGCSGPLRNIGASTILTNNYKNWEKNMKAWSSVCLSKSVLQFAEHLLKMRLGHLHFCSCCHCISIQSFSSFSVSTFLQLVVRSLFCLFFFLPTLHCPYLLQMWETEVKLFPPSIPFFGLFSNNAIIFQQQDWIALGISIHSAHQSNQPKNILDRITTLSVQYNATNVAQEGLLKLIELGFPTELLCVQREIFCIKQST